MQYQGPLFDADSHIYEKPDAWMRYMPEKFRKDYTIGHRPSPEGNLVLFVGDKRVSTSEGYLKVGPNGERLIGKPGSLKEFLLALKTGDANYQYVPVTEDHLTAEARIGKLDAFGVEGQLVFPGECTSLPAYFDDVPALTAMIEAYNRYLDEEWLGFNHKQRIFPTPILTFEDRDWAAKQIDWALARGARAFVMPVGPVGEKSPADPYFDPLWARLNEAGAVMCFHIAEAKHMHLTLQQWGETALQSRQVQSAWMWLNCFGEVPLTQTISSLIFYNLFQRFPKLRFISAENGAEWIPSLRVKMDKVRGMAKGGFWPCGQLPERPSRIFDRHVHVVAYPEDDIAGIVEKTGTAANILMGSDYPHTEGVPEPRDFVEACRGLSAEQTRAVMYDNGRALFPA